MKSFIKLQANTYLKAFILAALILSMTTTGGLFTHDLLYGKDNQNNYFNKKLEIITGKYNRIFKPIILFFVTFIVGLLAYLIMFYIFGFGQGMLIPMKKTQLKKMTKNSILLKAKKPATTIIKKIKIDKIDKMIPIKKKI